MIAVRMKLAAKAAAVALVAGLLAVLAWRLANQSHVPKGMAPNFDLTRLDGKGKLELASLRGKAVVLNFWASWCVPCKQEAPDLEAAWQRWRNRDVVFVGIDSEDFSGDARRFLRRHGITYPAVHDGPGNVKSRYGVVGYPETFFVDRRGRIVGRHEVGPVTSQDLETNVRRALRS